MEKTYASQPIINQSNGKAGGSSFSDPEGKTNIKRKVLSVLVLLSIAGLILFGRNSDLLFSLPSINSLAGSGLIFIAGLVTGVHCVGMCGSFILTYVSRDAERGAGSFKSHLSFSMGKIVSYTLIGAVFGAAGSLFTITPFIGGLSVSLAGLFLFIYGISMSGALNLFRYMKIRQPEFLNRFTGKGRNASWHPLLLGLSSGLLIGCGPLQAMYILAAGSADIVRGAEILFLFAAGTLPALMAFAFIARKL